MLDQDVKNREIRELLKHSRILNMLERLSNDKQASNDRPKKREDYNFWKTQPVCDFNEQVQVEGPIDAEQNVEKAAKAPLTLLPDFEWHVVDLDNPEELEAVYLLLRDNYVEDVDSTFRFNYPKSFLRWALQCPDYKPQWHLTVRVKASKKIVAFISAIPLRLYVRGAILTASEVNFLCIHKKLRSKRLAPVLIKEVTRRCHLENVWQALYTAGTVLPSPVATCRIWHRTLNWSKLYEVGFTFLPKDSTREEYERFYSLEKISHETMEPIIEQDLAQVKNLLLAYLQKFEIRQEFTLKELGHWLLPSQDKERVVWSYVLKKDNVITDFVSFYSLPSSVLQDGDCKVVNTAYLFYYATSVDIDIGELTQRKKERLQEIISIALEHAKILGFDVFNALTLMDNNAFLERLKFGPGDGMLNYYLYNYKANPIASGMTKDGNLDPKGSSVGIVML